LDCWDDLLFLSKRFCPISISILTCPLESGSFFKFELDLLG
jgi:hypothetical protein